MRFRAAAMAALSSLAVAASASLPPETLLWPKGAPGALGTAEADRPAIFLHCPAPGKANGTAVVICPGGAYCGLAMDYEGHEVAEWFNTFGVTAAVLRYRLGPAYHHPAPLQDAQRAIRYLRANAKTLGINEHRIGILGFSAGGHLAATASTKWDAGNPSAVDRVDRVSSRPDFAILAYPVITMTDPYTHAVSRDCLLGPNPSPALVAELSAEKHVTKDTPPTFLFHTTTDGAVPVDNSLLYYAALRQAGVPAELHLYRAGDHGMGMNRNPANATWPGLARDWLHNLGLL